MPSASGSAPSSGHRSTTLNSDITSESSKLSHEFPAQTTLERAPSTAGYLGSTSFMATFSESGNGELDRNEDNNIRGGSQSTQAPNRSSPEVKEGAELLWTFIDMANYPSALKRWYEVLNLANCLPYIHRCIDMVTATSLQSPDALLDLSYRMGVLTATPTKVGPETTLECFAEFCLGDGFCWEILGLLFAIGGHSAMIVEEVNELDDPATDNRWKDLAKRLLYAGEKCNEFCSAYGHLNILNFHLRLSILILHTQIYGDAGQPPQTWLLQLANISRLHRLEEARRLVLLPRP